MSDEKKINNTKQLELNIDYLSKQIPYTVELFDGSGNLRRRLTEAERLELQELLSLTIKDINTIKQQSEDTPISVKEYLKTKRRDNR